MRLCKVDGCSGKHQANGYCVRHYYQFYNKGKVSKRLLSDPNEIVIKNNVAEIILCDKKHKEIARAIIDTKDVKKIKKFKWCIGSAGYVETKTGGIPAKLSHIVLGVTPNMKKIPDHKDRNKLNNRKENLRICTQSQNTMNRPKQINNTSGFKGVSAKGKGWMARINVRGKCFYLGTFKDKIDSAMAYNEAAIKYHGEFAYINTINNNAQNRNQRS